MADINSQLTITDCHHHLWQSKTHSWLNNVAESGHPAGPFKSILNYMLPDYLNDCQSFNVIKSVHLQCFKDGYPPDETKWLQEIADANPNGFPHGIIGHCDLSQADMKQIMIDHMKYKNFRGIRQVLNYHPTKPIFPMAEHDHFLTDKNWLDGLAYLSEKNLIFDLSVIPHQFKRAYDACKSLPNLRVAINHCGILFERDEDTMKLWEDGLKMFASLPNVSIKLSGLMKFNKDWNKEFVKDICLRIISIFGTDRCMFASNFPVDKLNGTFKDYFEAVHFALQEFNFEEQQKIFGTNSNKFYKI